MAYMPTVEAQKWALVLLNNLFEIERKLLRHGDPGNAKRNVDRIKETLLVEGLFYEDPDGQPFKETRTDLDATISGDSADNLVVTEVIKPIIRFGEKEFSRVVQKGIVVVQSADRKSVV